MMRRRAKALLVVATVVAVVAGLAGPAWAVTVNVEATGGTLAPGPPFGGPFELGPGAGWPPCEAKPTTLRLATDTPAVGRWTLTGGFTRFFQTGTPPAGPWYQVDYEVLSGTGTYAGSAAPYVLATSAPYHLFLRLRIYNVGDGDTCAKDALACTLHGRWVATSGPYSGTLPSSASGDVATLSLATNTAGGLNLNVSSCWRPSCPSPASHRRSPA